MKVLRLLILVSLIALSACGGKRTRSDGAEQMGPHAPNSTTGPVGPQLPSATPPSETPATDQAVGPSPGPDYVAPKDGYVLVLGPGLARGFAYLGVIGELEKRQVKIVAIAASEIGALIGGVWASSNANILEWEMHKFSRKTLLDFGLLSLGKKVAEGKKLYTFLENALKVNTLEKMKMPLLVASVTGSDLLVERNGSAKDIIRGAMGIPGLIKPYTFEDKERITSAVESPFPVSEAKDLGLGKTVCVDVIGKGNNFSPKDNTEEQLATLMKSTAAIAKSQLKDCDYVMHVPTDGISYLAFDQKAELIFRGKQAVLKWLEQVR